MSKEEIKEIIDYLEYDEDYDIGQGDYERTLYKYEIEKILDYIKSLQQENKELKEEIERQSKAQCILDDEIIELQNKIYEAVEYIKPYRVIDKKYWIEFTIVNKMELLEILRGKENVNN